MIFGPLLGEKSENYGHRSARGAGLMGRRVLFFLNYVVFFNRSFESPERSNVGVGLLSEKLIWHAREGRTKEMESFVEKPSEKK